MTTLRIAALALGASVLLGAGTAGGQEYPSKRINLNTSEIGGAGDFASRLIGQALSVSLGQPVIIENRAALAPEYVAKSAPDGYTLLHYGNTVWISPLLRPARWNALTDFAPVMLTVRSPNVVVVTPSLPVKSIRELIALAKARPGELNYASTAMGSSTHLAAELFNVMAGTKIVRINYKGIAMGVNDVISGRVQLMFLVPGAVTGHIQSGKLRALAVTGPKPSALLPGLPTVAASGVPGYESAASFGLFAPVKTPDPVIRRLNQETAKALAGTEMKERLLNNGMEVVSSSPEEFAGLLKSEVAKWTRVIEKAGIRDE